MNKYLFLNSLKRAMKEKNHTQKDLENMLEISQSQISKILNGQFSREGKAIESLMEYSNFNEYKKQHTLSGEIDKAVAEIWDGSLRMELQIADIIRRMGPALIR